MASSRNRVVSPMLRKQKMNAQVRKFLIGPTRSGVKDDLNCAYVAEAVTNVMMSEASRNPTTNFGNRRQISPASGLRSTPTGSQRVVATIDRMNAQMPIQ